MGCNDGASRVIGIKLEESHEQCQGLTQVIDPFVPDVIDLERLSLRDQMYLTGLVLMSVVVACLR